MNLGPEQQLADGETDFDPRDQATPAAEPSAQPRVAPAGMFRRMAALLYDSLVVVAVLMAATVPFLPFLHGRVLRPEEVGVLAYLYWAWEAVLVAVFLGFFWTRRGQTLGMQAWRLRIEDDSGKRLSWRRVLLRQACAVSPWLPGFLLLSYADFHRRSDLQRVGEALLLIGLFAWAMMWFDSRRRTWHDRMSGTRIVVLPKKSDSQTW